MPHRRMLAPIVAIKHYVNNANEAVASGAIVIRKQANAVVAPATGTSAEVLEGSIIKAIYIEAWIGGDGSSGVETQFGFIIEKHRELEPDPTAANLNNLGSYANKKNVLYTTQGIIPAMLDGGMTIPVFRGWLKIPKGKQRFGAGDELQWAITAVGAMRICGFATYKEYR